MDVALRLIAETPDELRFFILADGRHAGGITVYAMEGGAFSYGIAIAPALRRQGIACRALWLLFDKMRGRGYHAVFVRVAQGNVPSLALHQRLGFLPVEEAQGILTLSLAL